MREDGSSWIKLRRGMLEWEWYDHIPTKVLFMHLLLKANYKATRYRGHAIPEGACVTGQPELALQTGLTRQQVRTALKNLTETGEITISSTNKFSIISMVKWSEYQSTNQQDNSQPTNNQPSTNIQVTTDKELNKLTVDVTRDVSEVVRLGKQIDKITGWDKNPNWFGDYSRINTWFAEGWSPDLDIIPTIKRLVARKQGAPPTTLGYFEQAIADAHIARLKPLPEGNQNEHTSQRNNGGYGQSKSELADQAVRNSVAKFCQPQESAEYSLDDPPALRHEKHLRIGGNTARGAD